MAEKKLQPENKFCKNIFRTGEGKISKADFTQKWIELINAQDKNKILITRQ